MPVWLVNVKEVVVNLRLLALGVCQNVGLQAPGIGGHFGLEGLG